MVLEVPEDHAGRWLDQQYMLGQSLLVAPVFNPEGEVCYYLPEGTWTDFFTGETKEGGRYYRGTYDYFSLPLYVRENSLLALGTREDRPDYDYPSECGLHLYAPLDGVPAVCRIPDPQGDIVRTVSAVKRGDAISWEADGDGAEEYLKARELSVHSLR